LPYFLLIETSSDVCSVAVATENDLVTELSNSSRDHASALAVIIKNALHQANVSISHLSCVGVNGGPGSYTGLRIGLSIAKGLCSVTNVPLIMIDSLLAYANGLVENQKVNDDEIIISTVDKRRDELFYAVYDSKLSRMQDVMLTVASDNELQKRLGRKCIVAGSALNKLQKIYPESDTLHYVNVTPSAKNLLKPVVKLFNEKQFADLAYSEPFYYKEVYIAEKKIV
jgi:tRNA threonylcarbamoyladenosine biosynthesis protein TsaB